MCNHAGGSSDLSVAPLAPGTLRMLGLQTPQLGSSGPESAVATAAVMHHSSPTESLEAYKGQPHHNVVLDSDAIGSAVGVKIES